MHRIVTACILALVLASPADADHQGYPASPADAEADILLEDDISGNLENDVSGNLREGAGESGELENPGILNRLFMISAASPIRRETDYEFDLDTGDIVEVVYVTFDTMVTLDMDAFYEPHGCPVFRAVFTNTVTSQWYLAVYAFEPGQTEAVFSICIPEGVYEVQFPETDRYDLTGNGITIDTAELSDGPLVIRNIGVDEHTDWSGCSGTDYR